jgi:hypothetical protein
MRREPPAVYWQGFADLAIGLMAVFVLILLLVLGQQRAAVVRAEEQRQQAVGARGHAQRPRETADKAKRESLEDWRTFGDTLKQLVDRGARLVADQRAARRVVRSILADPCPLTIDDQWRLVFRKEGDDNTGATLYEPGETRLSTRGAEALSMCRHSFVRLAYCLSPPSGRGCGDGGQRRTELCEQGREGTSDTKLTDKEMRAVRALRRDIEALVLEGSTDRVPYRRHTLARIETAAGGTIHHHEQLAASFSANAHLGAERARQALGHLIAQVESHHDGPCDALEVLLNLLRVETPSFGRFQVGPYDRRERRTDVLLCVPGSDECEAARSLRLRIRWREEGLRRPYQELIANLCDELTKPGSALREGMARAQRDPAQLARALGCSGGVDHTIEE